jgi:Domain of unknown function (DUF4112)
MSNVNNSKAITLDRLRQLSHLLDNAIAIPGTNYRIGLDPILGLLPGGGDTLAAIFSAYIVLEAARLGAPRATLVKMVFNIIFDTIIGIVPVVGDLFDFAWKANTKNLTLLEEHMRSPNRRQARDEWFVWLLLAGLLIAVIAITSLSVIVISQIIQLFIGN